MAEKNPEMKNLVSLRLDEINENKGKINGQNDKKSDNFSFLEKFDQYCEDKLLE